MSRSLALMLCVPMDSQRAEQCIHQEIDDGGADPSGDVCDAQHWHGCIGMEREAVDQIAGWIRNPVN